MSKFVLYVDYEDIKNTIGWEYQEMNATTAVDAIVEADAMFDNDTMFLVRIMEKVGKAEKVDDYRVQRYEAILEKRSTSWVKYTNHAVDHYTAKYGDRFKLVK